MALKVINGGFLTTIQDRGRYGYQKFGVSPSGVMDSFAARAANSLVDNHIDLALLETTVIGGTFEFLKDTVIAVTGGESDVKINENSVKLWKSHNVKKGDILTVGYCKKGLRNYISIGGGIDVPVLMGSRSTNLRAKMGGLEGRKLREGDRLTFFSKGNIEIKELKKEYIPEYSPEIEIGVLLGQQKEAFTSKGISDFFNGRYEVTKENDRMGMRLSGDKIEHLSKADIVSDGISLGAIQVPGDGQPIVMMTDRQTTGGYTKIGNVITADITKLAQAAPGTTIKFKEVKYEDAVERLKAEEDFFKNIEEKMAKIEKKKNYNITINGNYYRVEVDEIIEL